MPRFRFRLEKILGLRERAEKEAARRLSEILNRRQACLREMERLGQERRRLIVRREGLQRGRVRTAELQQNRYQIIVLDRAAVFARDRLADLENQIDAARETLTEKSRERRLIEKLKEKRLQEFELEERRRERRELDALPRARRGMTIAMNPPDRNRG